MLVIPYALLLLSKANLNGKFCDGSMKMWQAEVCFNGNMYSKIYLCVKIVNGPIKKNIYCQSVYQNIVNLLDVFAFFNQMQFLSLINLCREQRVHLAAYVQRLTSKTIIYTTSIY